jgi:hypothetical protein
MQAASSQCTFLVLGAGLVVTLLTVCLCFVYNTGAQTADEVAQVVFNLVVMKESSKRVSDVPFNIGTNYGRYYLNLFNVLYLVSYVVVLFN